MLSDAPLIGRLADIYRELGYQMRFAPKLSLSVMRDGGYRCSSNHVR